MKKKTLHVLRLCGNIAAAMSLALAILTVNSTCWLFSYQPDIPDSMSKYTNRAI